VPVADELQGGLEVRGRVVALEPAASAVRDAERTPDQLKLGRPQGLVFGLAGAQVAVEALHQLGQHEARARVSKGPGEPDDPFTAADLLEPGLTGRERPLATVEPGCMGSALSGEISRAAPNQLQSRRLTRRRI
jgi:hypothetical protein